MEENNQKFKTEFKIKNLILKNRLAIPPMVCFYWPTKDGYVTEKNIKHYEDLAKGGAALIIVEATAITPRSKLHQSELGIWEDGQIDGLKKIVDKVHENGSKIFIQLVHAGGNGFDKCADAPSDMDYSNGNHGLEMSKTRIQETVNDFVQASLRAQKAGFDGVEIHGCHGYLVSTFFNKNFNLRKDEYGQDKSLLAKEILKSVKNACDKDFVVGIRLGVFEPLLEDGLEHAKSIAPYTDFLDISYGANYIGTKPDDFPCSEAVYGASCVKKILPEMPIFGVHNINSLEDVEKALDTGIDMVDIGKASLVDPSFVNHIINGQKNGKCLHCKNYCRWNPDSMSNQNLKCPGYELFKKIDGVENKDI